MPQFLFATATFTPQEMVRFRRRNSSLENLNEILANDGMSDKPKEDRIVKFKDEIPETTKRLPRSVAAATAKALPASQVKSKAAGASILKTTKKSLEKSNRFDH